MTQEERQLLLKDLCARLPWGIKVQYDNKIYSIDYVSAEYEEVKLNIPDNYTVGISDIKPYLRPMSSMTEEEYKEYSKLWDLQDEFPTDADIRFKTDVFDWLNAHHFDYRGLIKKGIALEAPKGMYK